METAVLQYPLIVYKILKNLNIKDRRNCRLVCKIWNREALKLLSNPLLDIFKLLAFKDLQNCRLVCKKWNRFAEIQLQKIVKITFLGASDFERFNCTILDPRDFCSTIVFGKFVQIGDVDVQMFLTKYGAYIHNLELARAKWNISSLRKLLHDQVYNLKCLRIVSGILPPNPNNERILVHQESNGNSIQKTLSELRKITFDMNILDNKRKIRNGFTEFLTDLFSNCPNLAHFWCETGSIYPRTYMHDFIVNTSSNLLPNLGYLSCIADYDEHRIQQLESRVFPLTKVYLRIGNINVNVLHSFLQSVEMTLKQLGINYEGDAVRKSATAKQFPCSNNRSFKNLEILDLTGFTGQLDFVASFPKLKSLILQEVNMTLQFPFIPQEVLHPLPTQFQNLKELILVKVEDGNECIMFMSLFDKSRIKCSYYHSMDEFFFENSPEKNWTELQRDIYHFPFS